MFSKANEHLKTSHANIVILSPGVNFLSKIAELVSFRCFHRFKVFWLPIWNPIKADTILPLTVSGTFEGNAVDSIYLQGLKIKGVKLNPRQPLMLFDYNSLYHEHQFYREMARHPIETGCIPPGNSGTLLPIALYSNYHGAPAHPPIRRRSPHRCTSFLGPQSLQEIPLICF